MNSQADFASALLSSEAICPAGLCSSNGADPASRFAVYRNNVQSSLINALSAAYPVVAQLVGQTFFNAMARLYVQDFPPRSPLLNDYGQDLADFIQGFAPAAALPYLADVARLERLRVEAYHAADAVPLQPAQLLAAMNQPDHLGQLCLQLHPSLRTLHSRFAVVSLWAAHQSDAAWPAFDLHQSQHALVLRNALDVEVIAVDLGAMTFIDALRNHWPLEVAAAYALDAQAGFDLGQCLGLLLAHGALIDLQPHQKA
ncbi:DNA-binding domain-containing protein [Pseudomonas sp. TNT2022 ID357]|uniref:DNA-binding domain-containing protein n=1 Tax=Pseudomonas idahonensis TaxID=2942628 RepID=A0ABT5PZ53_9PSED|nr:DNA-binding domain-containing protein [Pseudomonas idahonensis]MDD1147213.1 DNA-binding domain-containing protein [Pseudomonas idahonensis]